MEDLKEKFNKEIRKKMAKKCDSKNIMAVPKLEKITVNTGIGEKLKGKSSDKVEELIDYISNDIGLITGQKPVVTKAKKSISGFDLRKGDPSGVKVTLRKDRMYNFLEKLINVVMPGLRDFRGMNPESVDRSGNLTFGIEEQISFPEIPADERDYIFSLQITITITAENKEEGVDLLKNLGFPFKKQDK